jgi:hypothetical protein
MPANSASVLYERLLYNQTKGRPTDFSRPFAKLFLVKFVCSHQGNIWLVIHLPAYWMAKVVLVVTPSQL